MEVHHHPDLHHRKKKWKEYLLEFLMIFLAVTLGFFAETIRERISEKHREADYIAGLINNIDRSWMAPSAIDFFVRMKQIIKYHPTSRF